MPNIFITESLIVKTLEKKGEAVWGEGLRPASPGTLKTTSWSGEEYYLQTSITHSEPGEKGGSIRMENKF